MPVDLRLALLIIDVHKRGLRGLNAESGSAPRRAFEFLNNVRKTADTLRERLGIPAYVVSLDDHNRIYPDEMSDPSQQNKHAREHLSKTRGLSGINALNPRPNEVIVSKNKNGVFDAVEEFAEYLNKSEIDGVILIGMDSSFCVAHSARGAIKKGFQCIIFPDLLAQSWRDHEGKHGGDPVWHEAAVRRGLDETTAARITFVTKSDFVNDPWKFVSTPEPPNIRRAEKAFSLNSAKIAEL